MFDSWAVESAAFKLEQQERAKNYKKSPSKCISVNNFYFGRLAKENDSKIHDFSVFTKSEDGTLKMHHYDTHSIVKEERLEFLISVKDALGDELSPILWDDNCQIPELISKGKIQDAMYTYVKGLDLKVQQKIDLKKRSKEVAHLIAALLGLNLQYNFREKNEKWADFKNFITEDIINQCKVKDILIDVTDENKVIDVLSKLIYSHFIKNSNNKNSCLSSGFIISKGTDKLSGSKIMSSIVKKALTVAKLQSISSEFTVDAYLDGITIYDSNLEMCMTDLESVGNTKKIKI